MSAPGDKANDAVQQSVTRDEARGILRALPLRVVQDVADLNHLDPYGSRATVTERILAERFGAQ